MLSILILGGALLLVLILGIVSIVLRNRIDLLTDVEVAEDLRPSNLWKWEGTISAGPYLVWILIALTVFINLSRFLAYRERWILFNLSDWPGKTFSLILLTLSPPFLWVVTVLTIRRLRTVGLPLWLAGVSAVPLVNLGFFLVLTVLRRRTAELQQDPGQGTHLLDRILPDTEAGSAIAGIVLTSIIGVSFVLFGTNLLGSYGWALFVLLPFFLGFLSVLFYGYRGSKSLGRCLSVSALSVLLLGIMLIIFAMEGLVCILMAMPIALPLALLGGSFAYLIQRRPQGNLESPQVMGLLILTLPAMMGSEKAFSPAPDLREVRTAVIIDAAPEQVWPHVVALGDLPEPDDWLLRNSIAYPVRTETRGQGPGAVRFCVFSTGPIVEPVVAWEYARRLRFSITQQPPLMRELSPYEIHPPHLEMQFLRCREGQFTLVRLPEGRMRLEGTSWYEIQLWPAAYWRQWTDRIAHRIHLRVLNRIKMLAEREARS